jgi:hypothetical protein
MSWLITPDRSKCLAFIPRCGSTAFGRAMLVRYYPELVERLTKCHKPPGGKAAPPQLVCPSVGAPPEDAERFALIRDPIERFRSGLNRISRKRNIPADEAIAALRGNRGRYDVHVRSQYLFIAGVERVKLYRFPEGIAACAAAMGLPVPPQENESPAGAKPSLTAAQESALRDIYQDDFALFAAASSS